MAAFFHILIVVVLLGAMVLVLLGISQLTKLGGYENNNETARLKEELDKSEEVMSDNNMFHKLMEKKLVEHKKRIERKDGRD